MPPEPAVHVIDDDEAVRDSLEFLFDSIGLMVRTYVSALDFLETMTNGTVGCVVSDVRMPQMSGLDLLRELRVRGANLPVIVVTGHGDAALADEAINEGAFAFVKKPFDDDELIAVVRRAVKHKPPVGR